MKQSSKLSILFAISLIICMMGFSGCGSGGGGGDNNTTTGSQDLTVSETITKLDDPEISWKVGKYFYTYSIREHIPDTFSDEVSMLLSPEADAGGLLTEKFMEEAEFGQDTSLCINAYLIEQLNYREAVPTLITWLESNIFNDVLRAPDCVTHTLKVLTDQDDLNNLNYTYDLDEIMDALDRAEKSQTSALSHFKTWFAGLFSPAPAAAASPSPSGSASCRFNTEIKGVDKNGSPIAPIPVKGVIFNKDFKDRGTVGAAAKARTEKEDEENYGNGNYTKVGEASMNKDCAGTVSGVFGVNQPFTSSDTSFILEASEKLGDELPDPNEITDVSGSSHTAVFQEGNNVRHVFHLEERNGEVFAVTKDGWGAVWEAKLPYKMKGGKKVFYLPSNDKQKQRYNNATLRVFKIDKSRVSPGSVPNTRCSTSSNCPPGSGGTPKASWITPLNKISYDTCSTSDGDGDGDDDGDDDGDEGWILDHIKYSAKKVWYAGTGGEEIIVENHEVDGATREFTPSPIDEVWDTGHKSVDATLTIEELPDQIPSDGQAVVRASAKADISSSGLGFSRAASLLLNINGSNDQSSEQGAENRDVHLEVEVGPNEIGGTERITFEVVAGLNSINDSRLIVRVVAVYEQPSD